MSKVLFRKVDYSLSKLIEDIDLGEIGLPDIQRPFVWPNTKVRDLFDSMYRGYPIGYLLFWENGLPGEHRVIGTDHKQKAPRLLIVDGQQRLTSLYAVLKGSPIVDKDYRKRRIYIAFHPLERKFAVADSAIRRDPEWIPDISELWKSNSNRSRFVKSFVEHLRQRRPVTDREEDEINEAIDRLYDLQNYPLTVLELSTNIPEEEVAEVFVRINSKGTPLNQADFILTLMSVFWDEGRAELEEFSRRAKQPPEDHHPSPYNYFIQPDPDQLLRVSVALGFRRAQLEHLYSLLRGKNLETREFSEEQRDRQFVILREAQVCVLDLQNWHEFFKALIRAGYRSSAYISSQNAILYTYAMWLVGKRDFGVPLHNLRDVIARWFFMVALTGRYTDSPESHMEQDLALLRNIKATDELVSTLDREINTALTGDYWEVTLPNKLIAASANNPGIFAYFSSLCLLDAQVLFSKMKVAELLDPALRAKKSALERHPLFPREYLRKLGIEDLRDINQVINYALVEWSDNVEISNRPPSTYVPELEARFSSEELQRMYHWHALPERWYEMDYFDFLEKRRKLMAGVIHEGFMGLTGAWHLS